MALLDRQRTGKGDYIYCAMFDSLLLWCVHTASGAIAGGAAPVSAKQRSLSGAAFYQVYETRDGKHVVLGGRETKFVVALLTALGRPDLIAVAAQPAGHQSDLIEFLRDVFLTRSRDEWATWFQDKDVAFAPVLDFREALDEPYVKQRGLWVEYKGAHHLAPAIRFATEEWQPRSAPELDGQSS